MRFLIDAQLPPKLAAVLVREGHEAEHVFESGRLSEPDIAIWRYAEGARAAIVTKDSDFAAMRANADSGPAIIWLRMGNVTNERLEREIVLHLPEIVAALETGETLIELA